MNPRIGTRRAAKSAESYARLSVILPVKTVSEANAHTHWRLRQKRAKLQRYAAYTLVKAEAVREGGLPALPAIITMTRLSAGKLDDDNLAGAMKHVRDGIADAYGVDDGDDRYDWRVAQERPQKGQKTPAVAVWIESTNVRK